MNQANDDLSVLELVEAESGPDAQFRELQRLELTLIGGGSGEVYPV
jgi:hypothetical protein